MGSGFSTEAVPTWEKNRTTLGDLPESCVAEILVNLDPTEICRLAGLNRAFSGAATSDSVWDSKLPSNYGYLLDKTNSGGYYNKEKEKEKEKNKDVGLTKKEIYARLCHPNAFDDSSKVFWLEKTKGGACMSISSKALTITGIDDRRYWNYIPTDDSRFKTVAYLQQIWWFEVDGEIEFCFPAGTYSLFFRFFLGRPSKRLGWRIHDPSHIHGWDKKPVRFQLSTSSAQQAITQCYLEEQGKWIICHVGDFVVENSNVPTKVKFSMMQIDCTHTKGGLCVDSVLICPKGHRPGKLFAS